MKIKDLTKRPTITNNKIQSQLRAFGDHLKYARSVAINRQIEVTVCGTDISSLSTGSTCGGAIEDGWIVFVDDNQDQVLDSLDNVLKVHDAIAPNVIRVTDAGGTAQTFIMFDTRGQTGTQLTVELCDRDTSDDSLGRSILIHRTGMGEFSRINAGTGVYRDITGADIDCGS